MLELYFDKRGEFALENLDEMLEAFPDHARRGIASTFRSEGFRLLGLLRRAIVNRGVNGEWPKLNPHTGVLSQTRRDGKWQEIKNTRSVWKGKRGQKKRVDVRKEVILSARLNPMGKFTGALAYDYDEESSLLSVGFRRAIPGWKRSRMLQYLHLQAEGYKTRVTPKMRLFFLLVGFPLKKTTRILETPKRALVEPMFEKEKTTILKNIDVKLAHNIIRYMKGQAR